MPRIVREVSSNNGGMIHQASVTGWGQPMEIYQAISPEPDEFFDEDDSENDGEDDISPVSSSRNLYANEFPAFELPRWSMDERDNVVRAWQNQMNYRLRWIFYREEKEGISRSRYISPFCPADFKQRIEKTAQPHKLNTPTNTFYDWKIGGADFLLRLEQFKVDSGHECLRCHFIHTPSGKELCYQDRRWDGDYYTEINMVWADSE